jgi:hypothetical protein
VAGGGTQRRRPGGVWVRIRVRGRGTDGRHGYEAAMLTAAASAAGAAPHERMQALLHGGQCEELRTREQELAKAHEHMRAAQWALAHASMVAGCDEWGPDGEEWEEDWEDWQDDTPASSEPGTPDWRGMSRARPCAPPISDHAHLMRGRCGEVQPRQASAGARFSGGKAKTVTRPCRCKDSERPRQRGLFVCTHERLCMVCMHTRRRPVLPVCAGPQTNLTRSLMKTTKGPR